jgi:hypothetical protein
MEKQGDLGPVGDTFYQQGSLMNNGTDLAWNDQVSESHNSFSKIFATSINHFSRNKIDKAVMAPYLKRRYTKNSSNIKLSTKPLNEHIVKI